MHRFAGAQVARPGELGTDQQCSAAAGVGDRDGVAPPGLCCDTTGGGWGPLTEKQRVPSLLNRAGLLWGADRVPELLARARLEGVELEFRRQIDVVAEAGLTPTHLDWHCLADGGRDDIFDLTLALADEYGLAVRAWLDHGRQRLRERGLPVVDHDFLDSFRLDLDGKAARYAALLRGLPAGLSEWAVHPGLGDCQARAIDPGWRVRHTDYEFLVSAQARQVVREEQIVITDYRQAQRTIRAQHRRQQPAGRSDRFTPAGVGITTPTAQTRQR